MSDRSYLSRTVAKQQQASDPAVSAWVSAHAGSGKTYVLTQRVLRLLLSGVRPSQILCLTFTKAAAANMSARIFDRLAKWAVLDDAALAQELRDTGVGTPIHLDVARQLFARAVETPGGLKIQTIHAFCERLLHSFPLEANAPAGFQVLDDAARAELLEMTRRRAIERARREPGDLHQALALVARETSAKGFEDICRELLERRVVLSGATDIEDYARRLRATLGLSEDETLAAIEAQMISGRAEWPALARDLSTGSSNDGKLAAHLTRAIALAPLPEGVEHYLSVFFTKEGEPRGVKKQKIVTAALQKIPGLLQRMEAERDRLIPLVDKRKAAHVADRSLALARLGEAILAEYVLAKRLRNLLDYDDLIERSWNLLNRSIPSWILRKLDAQVDHILLDEAQDTSARQWEILTAIASEFCSGLSARAGKRSFFAVGDDKQSIFSFQGAAPEKFDAMRRDFQRKFEAVGRAFEYVQLVQSFRSAPGVLAAVDDVFNFAGNGDGLTCDVERRLLTHEAAKTTLPALVEVWEPMGPLETTEPEDWRLPLDYAKASDPGERLARKIAAKIRALISPDSGEYVEGEKGPRPVEARDILIVVRKRGAFFEALIRALKDAGVPVAGADRLELTTHLAVLDLIAAGRAALLPRDDLTLACVLKSPLIGLTEDDILALAPGRRGSLWRALRDSAEARHQAAVTRIIGWRKHAGDTPFRFYARILGAEGGRAALLSRLGPEAADAADEFLKQALDAESIGPPSLVGFLHAMENSQQSIKRDMEAASDAVRVMTVHASKGLEAPIVFLPDTCGAPSGRHDPDIVDVTDARGERLLVWRRGKAGDPACVAQRIADERTQEENEHRRLL